MNEKTETRQTAMHPENGVHPEQARGQQYYKALCARDRRFDGVFFTGVLTTGIYCRPVCGVKTPRASSCRFFNSAAAAEHAGFRPCLRCRPELAPYALQQNLAHRIWHQIAEGALNQQSLEAYAAKAGLSSRQIRRVLLQEFGVSPVELAQTQRLLFAKKLLQETDMPVTDIAFAAGFGSLRRLNALFAERYQMTPGSVRRARQHSTESIVLRLAYRPPYDWEAVIRYLAFRAIPGVEMVTVSGESSVYRRTVSLAGHHGSIGVTHDAAKSQLILEVTNTLTPVLFPLMARVREQFDLEASPLQIADNLGSDPLIASLVSAHPGWRVPGAFDHFELAVRAVLGQQISVAGATTIAGRLVQRFGTPLDQHQTQFLFPSPQVICGLTVSDIAELGMPGKRAQTLIALAQFACDGGLIRKPGDTLESCTARLCELPGIGPWTAHYIAMRALRFTDAFPEGDLGLQKALAQLQKQDGSESVVPKCSAAQTLAAAELWRPWRAYAAMLLWQFG
ncbi:DNA-3-methyladenine glycosylase 2 family protein [Undibacterium luofuense]|nr:AlkA N-terminal domain-containing protein [Undibacterium luofuense]